MMGFPCSWLTKPQRMDNPFRVQLHQNKLLSLAQLSRIRSLAPRRPRRHQLALVPKLLNRRQGAPRIMVNRKYRQNYLGGATGANSAWTKTWLESLAPMKGPPQFYAEYPTWYAMAAPAV